MLVIFDVIGTLFSPEALRKALEEEGLPRDVLDFWLARLFHASFACTLTGRYRPYRDLVEPTLRQALAVRGHRAVRSDTIDAVLGAFGRLDPWNNALPCIDDLLRSGHDVAALTNGGRANTLTLMNRAGMTDRFIEVHSADAVSSAKPSPPPYRRILKELERRPEEATMVAVHGWDVMGASAIGMQTIWISRVEHRFPFPGGAPDLEVETLSDLPGRISG